MTVDPISLVVAIVVCLFVVGGVIALLPALFVGVGAVLLALLAGACELAHRLIDRGDRRRDDVEQGAPGTSPNE